MYYEIADNFITLSEWIDFHLDTPLTYTYSSSVDLQWIAGKLIHLHH